MRLDISRRGARYDRQARDEEGRQRDSPPITPGITVAVSGVQR